MKKTSIGGSALLEGLMMIGPENAAIAVRKPDGDIVLEQRDLPIRGKMSKVPVFRGAASFISQMLLATKAMMFSAEFIDIENESEKTILDRFLDRIFGRHLKDAVVYFSLIVSLAFSIGLFILLPNILAAFLHFDKSTWLGVMYYNLFEGILKLGLFLGYLALASRAKDIKRVWQYHGAEHKTINCYEDDQELTVENVMRYSTKNPRCGTSYMFLVIITSILLFSFLGWYDLWLNVLIRLLCIPIVAGLSFEVFRYSGKSSSKLAEIISSPGLLLQLLTTREPDVKQVEVAILAFNQVTVADKGNTVK